MGSVVAATVEGARPMLVEVQALVAARDDGGRRVATGVDGNRLSLLLAVLERHAGIDTRRADVYASVAGGVRVAETGIDLAVLAAVAGVVDGRVIDDAHDGDGGGRSRRRGTWRGARALRVAEAARLGFTRVVGPASLPRVPGVEIVGVDTVDAALAAAFARSAVERRWRGRVARRGSLTARKWRRGRCCDRAFRQDARRPEAGGARAPRCVRASSGSCRPEWVRSSSWVPAPTCCRCVRADSCSTPSSRRRGCRSWRRWTAPSSSPTTARASCGPTCTSSPIPTSPPRRPGTRHRTAERVARQIDVPVITISEDRSEVAVHMSGDKKMLEPTPRVLARADQALQILERYKTRLDGVSTSLSALEVEDLVTVRDVATVLQRAEMVRRIAEEIEGYVIELGSDGRLGAAPARRAHGRGRRRPPARGEGLLRRGGRLGAQRCARPPRPPRRREPARPRDRGHRAAPPAVTRPRPAVQPRGFRLLHKIPRVPELVSDHVVDRFSNLQKIMRASAADLTEVEGVGDVRARAIKEGLARLAESSILERYT